MTIGEKIKNLRISRNISISNAAEEMNNLFPDCTITKGTLSKWENDINLPDIKHLRCLSAYYGVTADYLINNGV